MTEERILAAALALFARKGFEGTSIREIASDAGITTASLYHYMGTKEDLLVEIMERELGRVIREAGETLGAFDSSEQKLAALVQLHVAVHGIRQLPSLVVDTEFRSLSRENKAKIGALRDEYESFWRSVLTEGAERKTFGVEDPKLATFALLEMCTGVAHWYSPSGSLSLEEIEARFADMALALVGATRDGRCVRVEDLELPDPARFYPAAELEAAERKETEASL